MALKSDRLIDSVFDRESLDAAYSGVLRAMKGAQRAHVRNQDARRQRMKQLESTRSSSLDGIIERQAGEGTLRFKRYVTRIPKKPGGKPERPISLFSFEERVILRSLLSVVWPHFELNVIPTVSYCTFRKGGIHPPRGIAEAVRVIADERKNSSPHIFETDIRAFFDSIDREKLLLQASAAMTDRTLNDLLRAVLFAETRHDCRYIFDDQLAIDKGLPQGAALSPLLACAYLSPFDRLMEKDGFRMLRYVDDFVILGTETECVEAESRARDVLKRDYGLDMHPDVAKTRQVNPDQVLTFLGHEITPQGELKPSQKRRRAVAEYVFKTVCGHAGDFGYVPGLPKADQEEILARLTSYLLGYFIGMSHCHWADRDYAEVAGYVVAALKSKGLPENRLSRGLRASSAKWPKAFVRALP